jgi:protocatechuate 4,5-dioxygenase beta chain
MATIVGGIATSHIPSIGKAIARGWQNEPSWKPFFDAYKPVHEWLEAVKPDVAVVIYNDHGLNFFLDKIPTFAVGAAAQYNNADEGWGLPVALPFPGYPELSWHLIDSLVAGEFDITMCQEMLVDHAFTVPMALLWPETGVGGPADSEEAAKRCTEMIRTVGPTLMSGSRPVKTVPISVNTVQFPLPSPSRCYKLGKALGWAIQNFDEHERVVVIATGGLSHQLDGERAGFINKKFDLMCLDKIVGDPLALTCLSSTDLVREAGAQGVELLMWFVMRGAMTGLVTEKHHSYHIPVSNTAAAVMVLENETDNDTLEYRPLCRRGGL